MTRHGSKFESVNPADSYGSQPTQNVVVAIDINGTLQHVQIGVWIDEGFVDSLKASAELRAGLVDALEHQINLFVELCKRKVPLDGRQLVLKTRVW